MSIPSSARTFVKVIASISLCLGALSVLTSLLSIVRLELFPDQERGNVAGPIGCSYSAPVFLGVEGYPGTFLGQWGAVITVYLRRLRTAVSA